MSHPAATVTAMTEADSEARGAGVMLRGPPVDWVTGASRGVGRGVAIALGKAGWTVYVTARSTSAGRTGHLPGTVEATAAAVSEGGGEGIGIRCDHTDDTAVAAAAARRPPPPPRPALLGNHTPA